MRTLSLLMRTLSLLMRKLSFLMRLHVTTRMPTL